MRSILENIKALDKVEDLAWANNITTEKYMKIVGAIHEKEKLFRCAIAAEVVEMKKIAPRLVGA